MAFLKNLFDKRTPVEKFWAWVAEHENELAAEQPHASTIERFLDEFKNVRSHVAFQLGGGYLEIGAGGDPSRFGDVLRLVHAAPPLQRLKVVAFCQRQPTQTLNAVIEGVGLTSDQVRFVSQPNGRQVDLQVYVEGITHSPRDAPLISKTHLLLHAAVGEYDLGVKVARLDIRPLHEAPGSHRPLSELPTVLDPLPSVAPIEFLRNQRRT